MHALESILIVEISTCKGPFIIEKAEKGKARIGSLIQKINNFIF